MYSFLSFVQIDTLFILEKRLFTTFYCRIVRPWHVRRVRWCTDGRGQKRELQSPRFPTTDYNYPTRKARDGSGLDVLLHSMTMIVITPTFLHRGDLSWVLFNYSKWRFFFFKTTVVIGRLRVRGYWSIEEFSSVHQAIEI